MAIANRACLLYSRLSSLRFRRGEATLLCYDSFRSCAWSLQFSAMEPQPSSSTCSGGCEHDSSRRRTMQHTAEALQQSLQSLDLLALDAPEHCEANPTSSAPASVVDSDSMPQSPFTPSRRAESDSDDTEDVLALLLPEICVDDCASSVGSDMSSHGSCTFTSSPSSPRSIFQKYWDKHGKASSPASLRTTSLPPIPYLSVPAISHGFSHVSSYEPPTGSSRVVPSLSSPQSPPRRNIFGQGCWSKSEPLLHQLNLLALESSVRKAHSWSALETASSAGSGMSSAAFPPQQRSCLRRGRFSGADLVAAGSYQTGLAAPCPKSLSRESSTTTAVETADYSSDCSAVTFSRDVRVVVFNPPREIWAPTGWSAWFSS